MNPPGWWQKRRNGRRKGRKNGHKHVESIHRIGICLDYKDKIQTQLKKGGGEGGKTVATVDRAFKRNRNKYKLGGVTDFSFFSFFFFWRHWFSFFLPFFPFSMSFHCLMCVSFCPHPHARLIWLASPVLLLPPAQLTDTTTMVWQYQKNPLFFCENHIFP